MDSPRVVVVGSFVQDLTFTCTEFPRAGETIIGQFITGPGGKGSNQAVAAARAGGRTSFIGAVGTDAFAEGARALQQAEGIECRMAAKPEWPTGTAGILVNSHGQNEIVVALGANEALAPADIEAHADAIQAASVLVTQLEADLAATAHAIHLARTNGATVILNPAPMRPDFDPALLSEVSILIPNETEFTTLVNLLPGTKPGANDAPFSEHDLASMSLEALHALCRRFGIETLIVTLGVRGCFLSSPQGYRLLPAARGIRAIDTTGAGDAFVGAFATALAEFGSGQLEAAARFANAAAGLSVTRPGTAPAMPRRAEIDSLLKEQGE
jgi:ribokinase